jgi:succinate-semialdehyde dehydrogenase / glutarate-semialdehyde dehydrogenase
MRAPHRDPSPSGPLPAGVPLARVVELLSLATRAAEHGATLPITAPFTGELLARIPAGGEADVREAVGRARDAQPAWAAADVRKRARVLLAFHDLLLERQREVLDLLQLETGKARLHAFEEVADCANVARYYGVRAASLLRPRARRGVVPVLTSVREFRHPVGVVGFIVPWNYPLTLLVTDALAAVVAGNAAVLRPDPQTSLTALWALETLRAAGLPHDVVTIVTGEGPAIGPPLAAAVDFLMFTGSTATGRLVAQQAAARLIGTSLELGGKNPMIVREDADLDAAVRGAVRDCFVGAGQVCVSIERIYVARSAFEAFVRRFVARTSALRLSAALDWSGDVGSLASRRQLDAVTRHVGDARRKGAQVLAGGRPRPDVGPLFYEPTILAGVTRGMLAHAEETFGPVVAVYPAESDEAAIAAANETPFGLTASIWTRDTAAGLAMARRVRAGSVNINEAYPATWGSVDAPIGGMKESGIGRRHGREGLLKFTEPQTVAMQRLVTLAPTPRLGSEGYARLVTRALGMLRRLPGLR